MVIKGSVESVVPEGLFIKSVKVSGTPSRLDVYTASHVPFSTTVECSLSKSSNNRAGTVTYDIVVFNNTKYEYAYRGLYYQTSLQDYSNNKVQTYNNDRMIGVITSFPNGRVVKPGEELTFKVVYTIGKDTSFASSKTYKTLLNYQFGINVETEVEAREAVNDKFANILNTATTYEQLIDVLDNKFDGSQEWTSNYVGNVGDASTDDSVAVNTLFAGQLQMIINGETRPCSVIIKHENLDWNNMTGDDYVAVNSSNGGVFRGYGCEMTLYLTIDPLSTPNGQAEVYVCVFTCNRDESGNIVGDWYRIGDSYVGLAPIVGYNGQAGQTGSFVTDNWVSKAATYSPSDKFSYTVDAGESIKTLVQVYDDEASSVMQALLDEAKAMIDDLTYAGTGIEIIEEAYRAASRYYTLDESGRPVLNSELTRAQLCPIIADFDYALEEAKKVIEGLG